MTRKIGAIDAPRPPSKKPLENAAWWLFLAAIMSVFAYVTNGGSETYFRFIAIACTAVAGERIASYSDSRFRASLKLHESLERLGLRAVSIKDGGCRFSALFLGKLVYGEMKQEDGNRVTVWIDFDDE